MWRQPPLDLTKDSHTQHKEHLQNVARIFLFILKIKHKTLHVKQVWAELENSTEKQSARLLIDQARQIYIINSAATRFQLYIHHILWISLNKTKTFWSWFANITNWSSNTFKPKVLEPNTGHDIFDNLALGHSGLCYLNEIILFILIPH